MTPASEPSAARRRPYLTLRPPARWAALNLRELVRFRGLLLTLATRDIKLRYRQTALGVAWVLLQPLLAAGIFAVVFGKVANLSSGEIPYFIFSFAGLLGWNVFSNTLTRAGASLVGNAHLVSKVYFPRLILPLSTVSSILLDFAVSFVVMLFLIAGDKINPGAAIMIVPVWVALLVALAMGAGLFAAALSVSYRDVQYIVPVLIQFALYASPVAYAVSAVPARLRLLFWANPLTALLEGLRWSLLGTAFPDWRALSYSIVFTGIALVLGAMMFKRMERRFADVI
jgi:lipopolysaccharide transport system permease protein